MKTTMKTTTNTSEDMILGWNAMPVFELEPVEAPKPEKKSSTLLASLLALVLA